MANTDYKFARDNNIYVIAGLPIESQVKYKYYAGIKEAVVDAPAGSCVIVEAGTYLISSSATNVISINKNLNIHFSTGVIINNNVPDYLTILGGDVIITGELEVNTTFPFLVIDSATNNNVYVRIKKITNTGDIATAIQLNGSSTSDIKVGEINCTGSGALGGIRITKMNSDSVLEIGKCNRLIAIDTTTAGGQVNGTIKNTLLSGSSASLGMIDIYNDVNVSLRIINSRIYNSHNGAASAGITNTLSAGTCTIKLINSVIQTTHASSESIYSDTALTLMALNSWANKATNGTINQTVTGGFTVEADVTV
jgi:hypothetical protein